MLDWSPGAVKATVGVGGLGLVPLLMDAVGPSVNMPFWLIFTITFLPAGIFIFATPDMMPAKIIRPVQKFAVGWYFLVAGACVSFIAYRGFAAHHIMFLAFVLIGACPCILAAFKLWKGQTQTPAPLGQAVDLAKPSRHGANIGSDDTLTFNASRTRAALLFIGSAAFVALGVFIADSKPLLGWSGVLFFGLGMPIAVVMLLPGASYLRLDADGFETCALYRRHKTGWSDVARFDMGTLQGREVIAITYSGHYVKQAFARKMARDLTGTEGAIENQYDVPLTDICIALRAWRQRFAQAPICGAEGG